MLVAPLRISGLATLVQFPVGILKGKTDVDVRMLFPYQQVLLPINRQEPPFGLNEVPLVDIEVRKVVVFLDVGYSERLVGVWDAHCV